jgi:hypothetical protein
MQIPMFERNGNARFPSFGIHAKEQVVYTRVVVDPVYVVAFN